MTHTVAFPGLGLEFEMTRGFQIGSLTIYWYAVIIAAGFLLAMGFLFRYSKKFGIDSDRATDVVFVTMITGIIGARAYYVIFNWDFYSQNAAEIFNTRGGGLAFYGSVIGGMIGLLLGCKWLRMPALPFMDVMGGALFIGQGIGRWGNFVNGECFGTNTALPWGMTGDNITEYIKTHTEAAMGTHMDPFLPVHPTFLYESLWCLIGLIVFVKLIDGRKFDGQLFVFYLGWNGFGRFFIEGLRTDSLMVGQVKVSQLVGAVLFIGAVIFTKTVISKKQKSDDPEYLRLWSETETGRLMAESNWDYKNQCAKVQAESTAEEIEEQVQDNCTDEDINNQETEETKEEE